MLGIRRENTEKMRKNSFIVIVIIFYTLLSILGNVILPYSSLLIRKGLPALNNWGLLFTAFATFSLLIGLFGLWKLRGWGMVLYCFVTLMEIPKINTQFLQYSLNIGVIQIFVNLSNIAVVNLFPAFLILILLFQWKWKRVTEI